MLSETVQHSNGSVPKRCSGREKDQRSAFTGAEKIQSQPHSQGEADAKEAHPGRYILKTFLFLHRDLSAE